MDALLAARLQMAFSLAFHMIFAALGVGMPLLMLLAQTGWLRKHDEVYLILTKRWARVVGILFAIGAVSGTVLSLELGLLWPKFMAVAGSAIGPAFTLEAFAFFVEAIFLGIYLYGWQRLQPRVHWLTGIPVVLASAASSLLVTSANAWMQHPTGLADLQAASSSVSFAGMLFGNPYWPLMALHSTVSCYAATAFVVAGVYAWGILHGKRDQVHYTALRLALVVGLIASVIMPVTGHASALVAAKYQPAKLAAMESLFVTEKGASLLIGGIPNTENRTVRYAIRIPWALSILAKGDPNAEVIGLNRFATDVWPNVPLTHYSFQIMVAAGMLMLGVALWFWLVWRRSGEQALLSTALVKSLVAATPLGFIALETGWIVTEVGRQPWIIYGQMRISQAVTPALGVTTTLISVIGIYLILTVSLVWLLRRLTVNPVAGADDSRSDQIKKAI